MTEGNVDGQDNKSGDDLTGIRRLGSGGVMRISDAGKSSIASAN
jgi:hypothetical protein